LTAGQGVGLQDSAPPTASHAPGHAAAGGEPGGVSARSTAQEPPLTVWNMTVAWAPYAIMSVFLLLTGFVRQKEGTGLVYLGPIQTNYMIPIPGLHRESYRIAPPLGENREHLPEQASGTVARPS